MALINITISPSQQPAKCLRPLRQPSLTHAAQHRTVMGHGRHTQLHRGALRAFVASLPRTAAAQTGPGPFHDGVAGATGSGQVHLVEGYVDGASLPPGAERAPLEASAWG